MTNLAKKSVLLVVLGLLNSLIFAGIALYFPNKLGLEKYTDYRIFILWYGMSGFFHLGLLDAFMAKQFKLDSSLNAAEFTVIIFTASSSYFLMNYFGYLPRLPILYFSVIMSLLNQYCLNYLQARGEHRNLIQFNAYNALFGLLMFLGAMYRTELVYFVPISMTLFSIHYFANHAHFKLSGVFNTQVLKKGIQIYIFNIILIILFDLPRIMHQYGIIQLKNFGELSLSQSIVGVFSLLAIANSRLLFRIELFTGNPAIIYRILTGFGIIVSVIMYLFVPMLDGLYPEYNLYYLNWYIPLVPLVILIKSDIINDIKREEKIRGILRSVFIAFFLSLMLIISLGVSLQKMLLVSIISLLSFVLIYYINDNEFAARIRRSNIILLLFAELTLIFLCFFF